LSIVYLAFGSNLGDRERNIRDAVDKLNAAGVKVQKMSTIIETDPVGGPPQGFFLNAAGKAETRLEPMALLRTCQKIESELGRVRTDRNGPRTIDIDILLYDDLTMNTPELTIPHPRMRERHFVMWPLREIAPEIV